MHLKICTPILSRARSFLRQWLHFFAREPRHGSSSSAEEVAYQKYTHVSSVHLGIGLLKRGALDTIGATRLELNDSYFLVSEFV